MPAEEAERFGKKHRLVHSAVNVLFSYSASALEGRSDRCEQSSVLLPSVPLSAGSPRCWAVAAASRAAGTDLCGI